jgi:lysophospholipase L1-like esterase
MRSHRRLRLIPALVLIVALAAGGVWWRARDQPAAARPLVYVALGASDAVGVGVAQPGRDGWVPRVQAGLPRGAQLVNLGINGATLSDVLAQELPVALDAGPRLVTLWPGVNDIRDDVPLSAFTPQLEQLLSALDATGATVALLNIPDLGALPAFAARDPAQLAAQVDAWNAAIADAAQRHGALLVDVQGQSLELAQHPEYVSNDGFHPSSAGYGRIAQLTLAALAGRLDVPA